jgi:hypothetical protein
VLAEMAALFENVLQISRFAENVVVPKRTIGVEEPVSTVPEAEHFHEVESRRFGLPDDVIGRGVEHQQSIAPIVKISLFPHRGERVAKLELQLLPVQVVPRRGIQRLEIAGRENKSAAVA